MNALERQLLTLAAKPDLHPESRALIFAAYGAQRGERTLPQIVEMLQEEGLPQFNLPSVEGWKMGAELVKLVGHCPGCCDSCAFRMGTIPNQSLKTVTDAMESALTGEEFLCHQDGKPCRGWLKTQELDTAAPQS